MAKKRQLVYELYAPSFVPKDPTAPGDNAFIHMASAAHKFMDLDPDYVWITPIFPSGGADGGYDIADLMNIDHRYGSLSDFMFLTLSSILHGKILLDIVLNHCSTKSELFQHDLRHLDEPTNCIWAKQPNNWDSLFGGSAWEYAPEREEYYLHLFTPGQPDLNWQNPALISRFREAVAFWQHCGVVGFRIDTCNILSKSTFGNSEAVALKGFEYYHQCGSAAILQHVFGEFPDLFTMGEMVGGDIADLRELSGPLSCCLNAEANDAADGLFIGPRKELDYTNWFKSLLWWCGISDFVLQLESHDFPRSPSRFRADPRALALLQFLLPFDKVCLYQGQEIGLCNPSEIQDPAARENARIPADQIFDDEYRRQMAQPDSIWWLYHRLIRLWRNDPVLLYGELTVQHIGADGNFRFTRHFGQREWQVNIDLTHPGKSYATDGTTTIA